MERIVVACADRKAQRALARVAGATRCPIEVTAGIPPDCTGAIVIADLALARAEPTARTRPARAWIAVPGDGGAAAAPDAIGELLAAGWDHVVAQPMPLLTEELLATVHKILRGDAFGLEKYVAWGAAISTYSLGNAIERAGVVALLAKELAAVGLPDRLGPLVGVIADELLANALYAAPVDERGQRFRAGESREAPRRLAGKDVVTLRWATDGRYLAIEVRDAWGTLDPRGIGARLAAARTQTQLDAGMGLPLVYACSNQLVLGVSPGERTEAIALLDVRYKPTDLARVGSYHVFT